MSIVRKVSLCQKCYNFFPLEKLTLEDDKYLCSKCLKQLNSLKDLLKSLPLNALELEFSYKLDSMSYEIVNNEWDAKDKAEMLINYMKLEFESMTFLDFISNCKIRMLGDDNKWVLKN